MQPNENMAVIQPSEGGREGGREGKREGVSKNISSLPQGERDGCVREERREDVISFHAVFDSRQSVLEQDVLYFYPPLLPPSPPLTLLVGNPGRVRLLAQCRPMEEFPEARHLERPARATWGEEGRREGGREGGREGWIREA